MKTKNFFPFWNNKNYQSIKDALNVIILAHVQSPRGFSNNSQLQCSATEHFSVEEFNEIYQGIVSAGYFVQAVYYNEIDFISDYTNHPDRFQNCLIYNLARNGLGDNKKTCIPAFCELVGLEYSTSASFSNALCRNKYFFSTLLLTHGIPCPRSWLLLDNGKWINGSPETGVKVICKPCSESASQGINDGVIFEASSVAFKKFTGASYIVQEYIDGDECEVPVFKHEGLVMSLPPVKIDLYGKHILDEQSSASNNYGFCWLSDSVDEKTIASIQNYAEKAFQILHMDIYGRIDFRLDRENNPYVFDISTTPYTTKHSSFAFAFNELCFGYSDIYQAVISSAFSKQTATIKR